MRDKKEGLPVTATPPAGNRPGGDRTPLLMLLRPEGLLGKVEWGFLRAPWVASRARTDTKTGLAPAEKS